MQKKTCKFCIMMKIATFIFTEELLLTIIYQNFLPLLTLFDKYETHWYECEAFK